MNTKQMSKQKAFEYCMYMILSSYFSTIILKSPLQEKNLLLHYKDLKPQEQFALEEQCIRYFDKIQNKIPAGVWEEPMEVHLLGKKDRTNTELRFESEPYIICVTADCSKAKPEIKFVFWKKKKR